eukprot:GHVH01004448.1.p2 GENE.GHVH01004448.1~~GHVH01004448.1.p2  ORF type:complete len:163 (+),score=20.08 GHVH01004448.1:891-1379(+)
MRRGGILSPLENIRIFRDLLLSSARPCLSEAQPQKSKAVESNKEYDDDRTDLWSWTSTKILKLIGSNSCLTSNGKLKRMTINQSVEECSIACQKLPRSCEMASTAIEDDPLGILDLAQYDLDYIQKLYQLNQTEGYGNGCTEDSFDQEHETETVKPVDSGTA